MILCPKLKFKSRTIHYHIIQVKIHVLPMIVLTYVC